MENNFPRIPAHYALEHRILPLREENGSVIVAMVNPSDSVVIEELQFIFNKQIQAETWNESDLIQSIHQRYQISEREGVEGENLHNFEYVEKKPDLVENKEISVVEDRTIIKLANEIISEAIRMKASDIHVESYENDFRIRFRIDGKLTEHKSLPLKKRAAVVSRLKIMADMDIAEKRRPQDGRIRMKNGKKAVDIRVSTLPTDFGEKVVLRILDKSAALLSLDSLGFEEVVLENFKRVLRMPHGMILVTGPTGSGKTTTLYAALNYINNPDVNIITIEDPIEYNLEGINQTMVKSEIGLTFANILRTILRQDPNIIMVGEIRDSETAEIAIRSALTGHLVLSTLHTNDSISTIVRLMDMGIEPFLIASSLRMVLSQRLIRKTCPHCKMEDQIDWNQYKGYLLPAELRNHQLYKGKGCAKCHHTGFSGREAIIEQLMIDDEFSQLILKRAGLNELKQLAKTKGIKSLSELGLEKAINGKTCLSEAVYETFVF